MSECQSKMFGVLSYSTSINLGDEIQSLAVINLLKSNNKVHSYYVDRDTKNITSVDPTLSIDANNLPTINTIYSGWFDGDYCNFPPNATVNPLFISFHINETVKDSTYAAIESHKINFNSLCRQSLIPYYAQYSPILCRDNHTVTKLKGIDVNASFGGCLTSTLDVSLFSDGSEKKHVYIVDVDTDSYDDIPQDIQKSSIHVTHVNTSKDINERLDLATDLLKKYANAKLVITSRLHCVLPCIAFGTPVIFMYKQWKTDCRFDGLNEFMCIYGRDKIDWNDHKNMDPDSFITMANKLKYLVKVWIQNV
jgi:hypothetical protein